MREAFLGGQLRPTPPRPSDLRQRRPGGLHRTESCSTPFRPPEINARRSRPQFSKDPRVTAPYRHSAIIQPSTYLIDAPRLKSREPNTRRNSPEIHIDTLLLSQDPPAAHQSFPTSGRRLRSCARHRAGISLFLATSIRRLSSRPKPDCSR